MDRLPIADRMSMLEGSGIRKFFDLAQKMKDPINLSIGQADFDPPPEVAQGAIDAIRSGKNRYTVTQGVEALRLGLRDRLARKLPLGAEDDILICSGVAGGLMLSYLCTLNPGDEVLIPDPYFVMYKHLARMVGAVPVTYNTYPDFSIRAEELERVCTPRTRAIIVNSPANPTGYVLSDAEVRTVAEFAKRHNLLIMSDEIYEEFVYDRPHISPRRYDPTTLVLGGFSKSLGIPGWRMGYIVGHRTLLEQMRILQQFSFVCAPTPAQYGVLAGLDHDFEPHRKDYRRKRDMLAQGLSQRFELVKPEGAFYLFPRLPKGATESAFIERCIEKNLLVVPGSACSTQDTHIRISFAVDDRTLARGIETLNQVADSF